MLFTKFLVLTALSLANISPVKAIISCYKRGTTFGKDLDGIRQIIHQACYEGSVTGDIPPFKYKPYCYSYRDEINPQAANRIDITVLNWGYHKHDVGKDICNQYLTDILNKCSQEGGYGGAALFAVGEDFIYLRLDREYSS